MTNHLTQDLQYLPSLPHPVGKRGFTALSGLGRCIRLVGLACCLCLLLLTGVQVAWSAPSLPVPFPQPVAAAHGIVEYRLHNGLQVLIKPMAQQQNLHVNLVYRTGSWADPAGQGGTAHLLEHMMFKDTPQRSADAVMRGLRGHGIRFNATTSYDRTRYSAVLTSHIEALDYLLAWEAERMAALKLDAATLEAERQVVLREMELADDAPLAALTTRMFAAATPGQGLGRHVLGTREELARIGVADLEQFHQAHYHPGNATLILTGRMEMAQTLAAIQRHFGPLAPHPAGSAPAPDGHRFRPQPATIEVVRGNTPWLALAYPLPPLRDEAQVAIAALSDILAGEPHGRLYQTLVQEGQALGVAAMQQAFVQGGYWIAGAVLDDVASLPAVQAALMAQLEGLRQQPVTEAELRRVQAGVQSLQAQVLQDAPVLAELLSESVVQGDWQGLLNRYRDYAQLSVEAVQQQAQRLFQPERRVVGHLLPATAPDPMADVPPTAPESPSATEVPLPTPDPARLHSAPVADANPYTEAELQAFNRDILAIEASIQRGQLRNGMATAMRPLPERKGMPVLGSLVLRFGDAKSLRGQRAASEFTATLLLHGTQRQGRQALADAIQGWGASLSIVPNLDHVTIRFSSPAEHLPAFLDLLADVLQRPAFTPSDFALFQRQRLAALARPVTDPAALAEQQMAQWQEQYPPGDPRRHVENSELLAETRQLTLEAVQQFHARFYGGNHAALALSGDFDLPATQARLERHFGAWNTQHPFVRPVRTHQTIEAADASLKTVGTQAGHLLARAHFPYSRQVHEDVAMWVAEHVLGRHPVHSWLAQRVRVEQGLSYQIGSSLRVARHGSNNSWVQIAGSYPAGQGEWVRQLVRQEWQRLREQGITEDEHRRAIQTILRERRQSLGRDTSILNITLHQSLDGETWQSWVDRNTAFWQLTHAQLQQRKPFEKSQLVVVTTN